MWFFIMNMSRNPTQALEPSLYLTRHLLFQAGATSKTLATSRRGAADPTSRYIYSLLPTSFNSRTQSGSATGKCGFSDFSHHLLLQYLRATFSARRVFPPCCDVLLFDARDGEAPLRARANQSISLAIFSLPTRFPPPPERLPGNV